MDLTEVIESGISITGFDLEQLVLNSLSDEDPDVRESAGEIFDLYFVEPKDGKANFKPVKFVYYNIVQNREGVYLLRRDLNLSPRAKGYFDTSDKTYDVMREVARKKEPILGKELKATVEEALDWEYEDGSDLDAREALLISYKNFSYQIAKYISDYFITCNKPIKDDIWYIVSCKEYGTATIYRDLNKSPRPQK